MILANVTYNGCGQNEQRRGVYPLRQVKQWSPLSHAEEGRWAWECHREPWHVAVPVQPPLLDTHALSVDHRSLAPTELKKHSVKLTIRWKICKAIFFSETYLWSPLCVSWDYSLAPFSSSLHACGWSISYSHRARQKLQGINITVCIITQI